MMTMTTRFVNTGTALVLACGLFVPAGAAQAQTLDEIIEASLEAAGGREAMARITSVRQTGTFIMSTDYGDLAGDTERVIIPNQKFYQSLDSDLFQQTQAWNGTSGWQSDSMQGMTDLEGQQAEILVAQTVLHVFLPYNTPGAPEYRKLDDSEVGGRPHHVVGLSTETLEFEVFVDAETKLVSHVSFEADVPPAGAITITAKSSGYEEHGGVMLATLTSLDIPGAVTIDTTFTTTELNMEVDQSIFEKP